MVASWTNETSLEEGNVTGNASTLIIVVVLLDEGEHLSPSELMNTSSQQHSHHPFMVASIHHDGIV